MLDLRQLKSFVLLAEELHFGRAAHRLAVTQPALSQQVKSLERQLNTKLFERSSRQVSLTPIGERFRADAIALLMAAQTAQLNVQDAKEGIVGSLRLAFVGSGGFGILPDLLRRYHLKFPQVRILYHDNHIHYPFELVEAGLIDVAVVRAPVTHPRLAVETFFREPLCAALPAEHRLASSRNFGLGDLANEPFAFFPRRNAPEFYDRIL